MFMKQTFLQRSRMRIWICNAAGVKQAVQKAQNRQ